MTRFEDISDKYDPHSVEERIRDHWDEVDAYERTKEHFSDGEAFYFLDGPPYTSGMPHLGTAWNKTLKDAYIRHLRMCGYDVYDRPGYDMHGLPVENKTEEKLGFDSKKEIVDYGIDEFTTECRELAEHYLGVLNEEFQSFGVWMDWDDPYKTLSREYTNSTWWVFKQVYDQGLVEQGRQIISQCPRCETAIANNEVEYEDVEDPSIYVKFPLADRDGSIVIWTTTPWTLVANTFVAVNEEATYVGVDAETEGGTERLYVAESCVDDVLKKGRYQEYTEVERLQGEELTGWRYEHPLADEVPAHPDGEDALRLYGADYVEVDRTGLVHSAPGHGEEDFERGTELGLSVFCPVGTDGNYTEEGGKYAGQYVRDANDDIVADLREKGLLLAEGMVTHSYGHCWRCDTGIIQLATDQWFIALTEVKEEALENISDSEWYPQWARDNRFRNFVEESPDWNISRQRYWGTPIPIWLPPDWDGDMSEAIVVESAEDLAERVDQDVDPDEIDLHKPTIDELTITKGGETYTRVSDVFDVWLDSGAGSWAVLNYPAETEAFERLWPADLIIEAHDQTRGWFWSQLILGTIVMDEAPYENVLMYGHTLDPDGRKMSKSVGNTVEPSEAIAENGADPMRLFLLSHTPQGEDMRFSWEEMDDMQRKLNIFWNVYRFPVQYMRSDGFVPEETDLAAAETEVTDEWVLSRLQAVVEEITSEFEEYRQDRALDALLSFVIDDVSRYYIQTVRERMWEEEDSPSKRAAYATLYHVLEESTKLLAPFAPYVAEEVYQNLTGDAGHETVHMCEWPEPDARWRSPGLERDVESLREIEEAGTQARQQVGRNLRWPVERVVVATTDDDVAAAVESYRDLLAERLNSHAVESVPLDEWGEIRYSATADMSELGPAFGDDAEEVMRALNEASVADRQLPVLEDAVEQRLGRPVDLSEEMVEFVREVPGWASAVEFEVDGSEGVVYVDTRLTEDIESEGYARELIRRVQEMRRQLELDMEEEIRLAFDVSDDRVTDLLRSRERLVADEVRAREIGSVEDGYREGWEIEDIDVEIRIEPVSEA